MCLLEQFKVAIVIPAYNEERTIKEVVESVLKYGDAIVVNDGSTDNTKQLAEKAGAIVCNHMRNRGYDQSLNSGFVEADRRNYDAVVTFDADGQHSKELLKEYIEYLKNGTDLVLGVRPRPARVAEWFFMFYTRFKFNWKDPLCGMKGYSINLYRDRGWFDSIGSIGTELATYGLLNNFKYCEIDVPIFARKDKPRFSSVIRSNVKILKALYQIQNHF